MINSGLTDVDGAKQIAANLFGYYDKDRSGSLDTVKVISFLIEGSSDAQQCLPRL